MTGTADTSLGPLPHFCTQQRKPHATGAGFCRHPLLLFTKHGFISLPRRLMQAPTVPFNPRTMHPRQYWRPTSVKGSVILNGIYADLYVFQDAYRTVLAHCSSPIDISWCLTPSSPPDTCCSPLPKPSRSNSAVQPGNTVSGSSTTSRDKCTFDDDLSGALHHLYSLPKRRTSASNSPFFGSATSMLEPLSSAIPISVFATIVDTGQHPRTHQETF